MKKIVTIIAICALLGCLFFIQKYFNEYSLFRHYPYTGECLHFFAGICVTLLISIFLELGEAFFLTKKRAIVIVVGVFFIALAWEVLEVYLGWNKRLETSEYVFNTIEDIVVTLSGCLVGLLFFVNNKTNR